MAGRIRTVKPEWLTDEKLASASDNARVASIGLILLADDYGNGRGHPRHVAAQVFGFQDDALRKAEEALAELEELGFVQIYRVGGQTYFSIVNWHRHQRIDKPGRPLVPGPDGKQLDEEPEEGFTYIARKGAEGPIKIGFSINPKQRAEQLSRQQPDEVSILAIMPGRKHEKALHRKFEHLKRRGEWFEPAPELLEMAELWRAQSGNARAVDGQRTNTDGQRPSALDLDLDLDQDLDQDREGSTRDSAPPAPEQPQVFRTDASGTRAVDPLRASFAAPEPIAVHAFEAWAKAFGKSGVTYDSRRAACLAERVGAGMTRQDAEDAIAGALADDYVTGKKDGKKHDRLIFIFGDAERYEEFRDAGRELRERPSGTVRKVPTIAERMAADEAAHAADKKARSVREITGDPIHDPAELDRILAGVGGSIG